MEDELVKPSSVGRVVQSIGSIGLELRLVRTRGLRTNTSLSDPQLVGAGKESRLGQRLASVNVNPTREGGLR